MADGDQTEEKDSWEVWLGKHRESARCLLLLVFGERGSTLTAREGVRTLQGAILLKINKKVRPSLWSYGAIKIHLGTLSVLL